MIANKQATANRILSLDAIQPCTKLSLQNIIFPLWDTMGLYGQMIRQYVRTKEQPEGYLYDEVKFRTVLRVIGGKVLMSGRPDNYCWPIEKVEKNAKNAKPIGTTSADGLLTLTDLLVTIPDLDEKKMLADMFVSWNKDLLLITTPEEYRQCIIITPELHAQGITYCVDEWMTPDKDGNSTVTQLNIGDVLIVTKNGDVYCIRHDEFHETHKINS